MILKRDLIHLNSSWKIKLCWKSLLTPKAWNRPSDYSDSHCNSLIKQYLISLYKISCVSIIINPSHFVSLTGHADSSSRNENNFHDVAFLNFVFFLVSIALDQLDLPTISCWFEILALIQPLVPPKSIIG